MGRSYNPNTKYGRRKYREEVQRRIDNYTPEEKAQYDNTKATVYIVIFILIVIGFFIAAATGNEKEYIKWLK